jgi:hypothetical protein
MGIAVGVALDKAVGDTMLVEASQEPWHVATVFEREGGAKT